MQFEQELELAVGDTIFLHGRLVTLIDIEDGIALFQLDSEYRDQILNDEIDELMLAGSSSRSPR